MPGATRKQIKSAARRLFLKYHPDLNPGERKRYEDITRKLISAYKELIEVVPVEVEESLEKLEEKSEARPEVIECIVFRLNNREFALRTEWLREVVRVKDVKLEAASLVSDAFPYFVGFICKGNEVSVLWNLHGQLGLREPTMDSGFVRSKIIVVDMNGSTAGFIVDDIRGLTNFKTGDVSYPAEGNDFCDPRYMEGSVTSEDTSVILLNLRNLIYNFDG